MHGCVLRPVNACLVFNAGVAAHAPCRAHAAHENGMESLIFFFAAVLAAKVADVDPAWAKSCATVYIIARLAFTYVYVYKVGTTRLHTVAVCSMFRAKRCGPSASLPGFTSLRRLTWPRVSCALPATALATSRASR